MAKIIECVPNFSEGRDVNIIDAIAKAISATDGSSLLDVYSAKSINRTIYTFVGSPEAVVDGAINSAKTAFHLIDMRNHKGEHPRLGALDVCPFAPVQNATMDDCVECANMFGRRAAEELGIPVYLYGFAAKEDYRRSVPQIRSGEYEYLKEKIKKEEWKPDYGTTDFIPAWGATICGARKVLIAININVLGTMQQAHRVALNLSEISIGAAKPGRLKKVRGSGLYLEEANRVQISFNLLDFEETTIHTVYEEAKKELQEMNVGICGSEVVGLVPLKSLLMTADYYIEKENLFILDEKEKVRLVIERLGLSSIEQFVPEERIIEYLVSSCKDGPLVSSSLRQFISALGRRSPAPGGGSASAAIAAMGAALGMMVGWMSYGNKEFDPLDATMKILIPPLHKAMLDLMPMVDADTNAFSEYMVALKMPNKTPEEEQTRNVAMQKGLKTAIAVPLKVMQKSNECWDTMKAMAQVGNIDTISDMQVGAKSLETGVYGAYCNVMINLRNVRDEEYAAKMKEDVENGLKLAKEKLEEILNICKERLESNT